MVDFSTVKYPLVVATRNNDESVNISAYITTAGTRILSNEDKAFDLNTGKPLRRVETASSVELSSEALESYVSIGHCTNKKCNCKILAFSEIADSVDIDKPSKLYCVQCAAPFTPSVDMDELLQAMASDSTEDDDDVGRAQPEWDEEDHPKTNAEDNEPGKAPGHPEDASDDDFSDEEMAALLDSDGDYELAGDDSDNDDDDSDDDSDEDKEGKASSDDDFSDEERAALLETAGDYELADDDSDDSKDDSDDSDDKEDSACSKKEKASDDSDDDSDEDSDGDDDYNFEDWDDGDDDDGYDDSDDGDAPDAGDDDDDTEKAFVIGGKETANTEISSDKVTLDLAAVVDWTKGRVDLVPQ